MKSKKERLCVKKTIEMAKDMLRGSCMVCYMCLCVDRMRKLMQWISMIMQQGIR